MDEKLSRALDRKSVITVPRQHKNFLVAWAKNAKSHINRCLVNVFFLAFIWHKFPGHMFWNRSFQHIKIYYFFFPRQKKKKNRLIAG